MRALYDLEALIGSNSLQYIHGTGWPSDRQLIHFASLS